MPTHPQPEQELAQVAALIERGQPGPLRDALLQPLERPGGAAWLRALDAAGLLTQIIPELEPARATDQPSVHFLPVLAHSLETVAALDWLLAELRAAEEPGQAPPRRGQAPPGAVPGSTQKAPDQGARAALPAAVQAHPALRYRSAYAAELQARFAAPLAGGYTRAALLRLAALLHDVAKPQTKRATPDGGVSFHEHQTIGGAVARQAALRLGLGEAEADYVGRVVRGHMRPGQLAAQGGGTLRAVRRFFHSTGDTGPDLLLHGLADHMATRGPHLRPRAWLAQAEWTDALLDTIWGQAIELARPLISGTELMQALGIPPGPLVGRLLAAIGEAQAGGDIASPAEALALARRLLGK